MSLMKRALDGVRRGLNQIGRNIAGAAVKLPSTALPGPRGGGKKTFDPIWVGRLRPTYSDAAVSTQDVPTAKQKKRARDNEMRAGLPSMSGRQWKRVRKMLYRRAKALTLSQRQETTG